MSLAVTTCQHVPQARERPCTFPKHAASQSVALCTQFLFDGVVRLLLYLVMRSQGSLRRKRRSSATTTPATACTSGAYGGPFGAGCLACCAGRPSLLSRVSVLSSSLVRWWAGLLGS